MLAVRFLKTFEVPAHAARLECPTGPFINRVLIADVEPPSNYFRQFSGFKSLCSTDEIQIQTIGVLNPPLRQESNPPHMCNRPPLEDIFRGGGGVGVVGVYEIWLPLLIMKKRVVFGGSERICNQ